MACRGGAAIGMALYCNLTQNQQMLTWELEDLVKLRYIYGSCVDWRWLWGSGLRYGGAQLPRVQSCEIYFWVEKRENTRWTMFYRILQDLIGRGLETKLSFI